MDKKKNWHCPKCPQTSNRPWNLRVHIQRKHAGIGQPVREADLGRKPHLTSSSTTNGLNKTVQNNSFAECDRIQEITDELVELKTILSKQFLKGDVAIIVENCCSASVVSGDKTLLNSYLEWGRKWARFGEKLVMLVQGLPKNNISTMLRQAFTRAVNTPNQISHSPVFFDDGGVDSYYPYGPQERKPQAVDTDRSIAEYPGYTGNRDYPMDPFVYYFGVSEETFYEEFYAWQRRNSVSIASLF